MIELIFKLGIFVTITVMLITIISQWAIFSDLISATVDDTSGIVQSITAFAELLQQYITPWIGLFNNMLSQTTVSLLMSFIVWKMIKKFVFFYIETFVGITRSIIQKIG